MEDVWIWAIFGAIVIILLALDLFVFNRGNEAISTKKALKETTLWITVALLFGAFMFIQYGTETGIEYLTAYAVEKAMSMDNLFVFIMIFAMFSIPDNLQHKALFYGIVGAVVFRAIFIFAGVELLERFHFIMYIFGIALVYAALKTMFKKEEVEERNRVAEFMCKHFKVSPHHDGDKLFTVVDGIKMMTPLMMCIIVVELTDIIFALDSIPAVLAISTDTLVVYTSNIFAILGLRSLYFAIRGGLASLRYLKYGLGIILMFVAVKLLISGFYHIPVLLSLLVILGTLAVTVMVSLAANKRSPAV